MAEKLFEAHFESLKAVYADALSYKEIALKEVSKAQSEFISAQNALLSLSIAAPASLVYELKYKMREKNNELIKAKSAYTNAVKYLDSIQALLDA